MSSAFRLNAPCSNCPLALLLRSVLLAWLMFTSLVGVSIVSICPAALAAPPAGSQVTFASTTGYGPPRNVSSYLNYANAGGFSITAGAAFLSQSSTSSYPTTLSTTGLSNAGPASVSSYQSGGSTYSACHQALSGGSFTLLAADGQTVLLAASFSSGDFYGTIGSSSGSLQLNNLIYTGGTYFAASGLSDPGSANFSILAQNPFSLSGSHLASFQGSIGGTFSAAAPFSLTVAPSAVTGGSSSLGTVTLSVAAPAGGLSVTLTSSSASATVPATVTIPDGQISVSFPITTTPVAKNTPVTVSAAQNGYTSTASLTVAAPLLISMIVNPATVTGGQPSSGTVTLNGPAPSGGTTVTLSSSNAAAAVPANVTIPAGTASAGFSVTTTAVSGNTQCSISATLGTQTLTAPLTVTGATALSLKVAPTSVVGGNTAQGTVTLSSPAPASGAVVSLSSSMTAAGVTIPSQVTVAGGAKTAAFTLTTQAVGATLTANISATEAGNSAAAPLTVTPPALTGLTLAPTSVVAGQYSTGTVTISSPAPSNGLSIPLSSDNAAATVASMAVVAAGATSGTFPVATSSVPSSTTANISAALGGVTESAPLNITASYSVLTSIVVTPGNAVVQTGASQQFTATALDQNGVALSTQPTFAWSVSSGAGSIGTSTGLFTAGSTAGGPFTVTATAGSVSGTASVTVETSGTTSSPLTPSATIKNTKWTIAGYGGMRYLEGNSSSYGTGNITISGVNGTVTKAYLYWHGPTNSTDPTVNAVVTFNGNSITGTNIGFASDNCWDYLNSQAYRADVTSLVPGGLVNGSGTFSLSNFVKGAGSIYSGDLEEYQALADINGVTLIVFYNDGASTGNRDVMIFDGNDSNVDLKNNAGSPVLEWNDSFNGINYAAGTTANLWLGVSDGQNAPDAAVSINGTTLIPFGYNFNGNTVPNGPSASGDRGGLWDIRSFNISSFLSPGSNTLNLVSLYYDDCLSLIYAIVDQPASGSGGGSLPSSPPTIATAASANPNPVSGATTNLSVLGADAGGEVNLTYTWKVVGTPPSPIFLSLNGTNAAKNTVATFTQAGTYMFQVTVQNQAGLTATSYVTVTVNQTLSSLVVMPAMVTLPLNGTQQFAAAMTDQFGTPLSSPPAVTWSVASGLGSVSNSGLYNAGSTAGAAAVQAAVGSTVATATVTIANAAPTVAVAATANPNPVTNNTTTLSVLGADDGGESNLTYTWATTGTPPAAVTYSVNGINAAKNCVATFTQAGSYTFQVVIRDAGGLTATSSVTVTVNQTQTGGSPVPVATPVIAIAGGDGSAVVSITDGTPGATIFYTLDGTTPTSASPPYQGPFVVTQTTTIEAIAYLSSSSSAVAIATATVTAGAGGAVPGVAITSPADGSMQTGGAPGSSPVIPIVGSVSGSSLSAWTLAYRPVAGDDADEGNWIPISAGTAAQPAGSVLGTLDPTLMLNGQYQIELTAYNTAGQSDSALVTILIKGDQKVGYFTLSYNDLTVPISGLPITITRTYDSRNKGLGDFGTGWTLSTTNVQVQKADTIGLDWTEVISGFNYTLVPNQSHLITVTFPNGDTYNFVPYIAPQQGDGYDDTGGTINFMPVGPVQGATLISKNNPSGISFVALTTSGGGNAVGVELDADDGSDDDSGYPADEDEFILTLRNGKQFDVSIDDGLESIRDLNGNTVSFTPGGIYSSSYSASTPIVSYQRTNGLISQIIGPSGNPLTYTQTGTDLTGFTDRASNLSTYDYDYTHDLTGIHDPRGLEPLRNDYDASGRLQDSVDADQNKITYNYDLIGHTQTVFDRLGHETDFSYDSYGNVTAKTQHLIVGGVDTPVTSISAFDDPYNPDKKTQDTDPLRRITNYVYLPTGELLTTTQQRLNGGQPVVTSYTYNNYGEPLTVQDANNQETANYATTSTYDGNGNLKTTKDALGNTSQFFYNPNGTPDHTIDANNNTTYYSYAAGANYPAGAYVTGVKDALGHVTSFDYDADGNKISQVQKRTNAAGGTDTLATSYQYDADDRLNVTVFPDSTVSVPDTVQTVYNSIGKVDHTVDPLGRTTSYKYDDQSRATETDYQDGTRTLTSYDLNGQRLTSTDRAGRITGNVYDTLGRLTQSGPVNAAGLWLTDSSGNPIYSQTSYDNAGQTLTETDQNGNVTAYTYDDLGRKATVKDAAGNVTVYNDATDSGYDLNGNQLKVKDARGNFTKFQYDLDNHLLETDLYKADGVTLLTRTQTGYDALGRRQTSTDGDGNTTTYNYDAVGRLASVLDARNKTTSYGYDELGEKISQTDANLHTTKFAYDLKGHLVQKTLPALQSMTMGYNVDGTLATQTDYNGVTTSYTYEPNTGRLSYKVSSTGQWVGYDYYADGSRQDAYRGHGSVSFSAADSTLTNTYDALGRLQTVHTPAGLLTYGYDRAGNRTSLSTPSGTTTYDYDADNRLFHVYHKDGVTSTYAYDANGNRQSLTLPNGVTTTYTYDEANRLTLLVNATGATTLSSYAYALYPSGRRQSVTDATGGKITYAYDTDGRLTSETSTGLTPAIANSYGYDSVGNRISLNGGAAITYDADDRLTTPGHSYDNNGNETTVNGQTATYDFENHLLTLVNAANNTVQASYTYDADGNRLSATTAAGTASYLVDTNTAFARVMEEYTGGALSVRYDYGDDLLRQDRTASGGSLSYYLYDGLGSTRQLTNSAGAVTDGYLYDAYGVGLLHSPSSGVVNAFLFQGQQFDAASNDYYQRARYYDPTTGRFLSQDPFEGNSNDPISLHRYLYAGDDPMDNIDPSGNEDFSISNSAASIGIGLTLSALGGAGAAIGYQAAGGNAITGLVYGGEITASLAASTAEGPKQFLETLIAGLISGGAAVAIDEVEEELRHQDLPEKSNDPKFRSTLVQDFIQGAAAGAVADAFSGKGVPTAVLAGLDTGLNDLLSIYSQVESGDISNYRQLGFKLAGVALDVGVSAFIAQYVEAKSPAIDKAAVEAVEDISEHPNSPTGQLFKKLFEDSVSALLGVVSGTAPKAVTDALAGP